MFWQRVCDSSQVLDVEKPALPRRRKVPRRLDDGAAPSYPVTVEDHYPVIYFEALDLITSCIAWFQNIRESAGLKLLLPNLMKRSFNLFSLSVDPTSTLCFSQLTFNFFTNL